MSAWEPASSAAITGLSFTPAFILLRIFRRLS